MPKQSPVPDEVDQGFWEACNESRLVIQYCHECDRLQHPPQEACAQCGSGNHLEWREVSGRGTIHTYAVMYDNPVPLLFDDQPFNVAVIALEDDPGIKMLSHLPGTPVDEVPIGAPVKLVFEKTQGTGQMVPEWQVVTPP
ncbi:MAG: Zn-ribbon domain-containing OB-fold protein [Dehalococcoidia bacterium]|nr:Zn-ribbon domain-containing OB-fold protein [Dehalococcoidia bacterium]